MTDCIFCKIIAGKLPAEKVYEDDDFLAFQALRQTSPGHTLVIPKEHSRTILEMRPELGSAMLVAIQKVSEAMKKGLDCDGLNIGNNIEAAAGQVIWHTHIHLIPRWDDDQLTNWSNKEATQEERTLYAERIISKL